MSLLYKQKVANNLFTSGKTPYKSINKEGIPVSGYGIFSNGCFEFPLNTHKINGEICSQLWISDDTKVVYTLNCNGFDKLVLHCTLKELFEREEPYFFNFNFNFNFADIKSKLDKGQVYIYNDNQAEQYKVTISKSKNN